MMDYPTINNKSYEDFLEEMIKRIESYVPEWDPKDGDIGLALIKVAAKMLSSSNMQLNKSLKNNFITFLETLGIKQLPPKAASAPLIFELTEGASSQVQIPSGTQVSSEDLLFYTNDSFYATPAKLTNIIYTDLNKDKLINWEEFTDGIDLNSDSNNQEHIIYLSHDEFFEGSKQFEIKLPSDLTSIGSIEWQYYGQNTNGELGWFTLSKEHLKVSDSYVVILQKDAECSLIETEIQDLSSKWVRGVLVDKMSKTREYSINDLSFTISSYSLATLNYFFKIISLKDLNSTYSFNELINYISSLCTYNFNELYNNYKDGDSSVADSSEFFKTSDFLNILEKKEAIGTLSKNDFIDLIENYTNEIYYSINQFMTPNILVCDNISQSHPEILDENNLAITDNDIFYPFGEDATELQSFYFSSEDLFSKKGAEITLTFNIEDYDSDKLVDFETPTLLWQYWNGEDWIVLKDQLDSLKNFSFLETNTVRLIIPDDIEKSQVNGSESYWLCITIKKGYFGKESYYDYDENKIIDSVSLAPKVKNILMSYISDSFNPDKIVSQNNLEFTDLSDSGNIIPFKTLIEKGQDTKKALYFGFDQELKEGPINLYFDIEYTNTSVSPSLKWWYYTKSGWEQLIIIDQTKNLTRSGLVQLIFSDTFIQKLIFNQEIFWIKITEEDDELDSLPLVNAVYLNAIEAQQLQKITEEILGESDASSSQYFYFENSSVIETELWVNESETISQTEIDEIIASKGESFINQITDSDSSVTTWVKWEETDDFSFSEEVDRHYVIDYKEDLLTFGDGENGMIPPIGEDNIKVNYSFGGGSSGNIEQELISELKSTIPYVESVYNPIHSSGGGDLENISSVISRGPEFIKHRDKAVSKEDFEKLAKEYSSDVARADAKIIDNQLYVYIIPNEDNRKPEASSTLLGEIKAELKKKALSSMLSSKINVSETNYKEVAIYLEIVPKEEKNLVELVDMLKEKTKNYLHPLTGGENTTGWDYGRNIYASDIYKLIGNIYEVDHVAKLKLIDINEDISSTKYLNVQDSELICSAKDHIITIITGE